MAPIVKRISNFNRRFHEILHILMGVGVAFFVKSNFPEASTLKLVSIGVLGSLIPDLDHFFYFYIYGRKSEYSKIMRSFIRNHQIKKFWTFGSTNHKDIKLLSHNIFVVFACAVTAWQLLDTDIRYGFLTFFMSVTVHFMYDIMEDLIILKRLNSNWLMKFSHDEKYYHNEY